jgi:hypothetical protein
MASTACTTQHNTMSTALAEHVEIVCHITFIGAWSRASDLQSQWFSSMKAMAASLPCYIRWLPSLSQADYSRRPRLAVSVAALGNDKSTQPPHIEWLTGRCPISATLPHSIVAATARELPSTLQQLLGSFHPHCSSCSGASIRTAAAAWELPSALQQPLGSFHPHCSCLSGPAHSTGISCGWA